MGARPSRRLSRAGAAGVIVADLTPDEGGPFEIGCRARHGLAVVYLVAPTTPPERRAEIAGRSGGFLYCVSLVGVTGARTSLPSTVGRLVRDVVAASPVPVGVGFGVSRPAHARALARAGAGGVIVASALVDALGPDGTDVERMAKLVGDLAGGHEPMTAKRIAVSIEAAEKKAFATAVDWPGWSRSGKTEELAIEALATLRRPIRAGREARGRGVPEDRRPRPGGRRAIRAAAAARSSASRATSPTRTAAGSTAKDADRLARLVEAAWRTFGQDRGRSPRRAPQGTPRRRPRHVEDGRPRRRGR